MNLHKMIEICLKDDNMHIFVMINALISINKYVITCMNSMLSLCQVSYMMKQFMRSLKTHKLWSKKIYNSELTTKKI